MYAPMTGGGDVTPYRWTDRSIVLTDSDVHLIENPAKVPMIAPVIGDTVHSVKMQLLALKELMSSCLR